MELKVLERVMLFNLLPVEGDFGTLRVVRRLKEELELTTDEQVLIGFSRNGPEFKWERELDPAKEFDLDATALRIISDRLKDLDAKKKLTMQHYSLYERFVTE